MPAASASKRGVPASGSAPPAPPVQKKEKVAKRSLRKKVKAIEFGAPAKPGSGYMRFSTEKRPAIMDELRTKLSGDEKLKLADIGTTCANKWNELTGSEKAKYNNAAKNEKVAYDKKYAEWKTTDGFKEFTKANADHKQKLASKKAIDKAKNHPTNPMPSRGMTSYFLFSTSPEIQKLVKETCAKAGKPNNVKEKTLIVKPKWESLGAAGQKVWAEKARKAKAEYDAKIKVWNESEEGKEFRLTMEKIKKDKDKALGKTTKTSKRKSSGKQTSDTKRAKTNATVEDAGETHADSADEDEDNSDEEGEEEEENEDDDEGIDSEEEE